MLYKKIQLDPDYENVFLEVYAPDRVGEYLYKAMLVIPGGGYGCVCSDREGEPIALAFLAQGYASFVLHYSVAGQKTFPGQLIEASLAMKYIREHAAEYAVDPEQVFAVGFSAGGHLAGTLGTMWHYPEVYRTIDMPMGYNKPTGVLLIYPVVTGVEDFGHKGSFDNLLGTQEPTEEQLARVSLEKQVDGRSAPAYIVHTANDGLVDVRNSLSLAAAYRAAGLTFEMHIYPDAPHGVALGNRITKCGEEKFDNPAIAKWVENAAIWADGLHKIG